MRHIMLQTIDVSDTGLQFDGSDLSPFLKIDVTIAICHICETSNARLVLKCCKLSSVDVCQFTEQAWMYPIGFWIFICFQGLVFP